MPHDRFYIDTPLKNRVCLQGDELHHLFRVMRKKPGDVVELVNGRGDLAEGVVFNVSREKAEIDIVKVQTIPPALPKLILIQALPKPPLLDMIVQKGTELGVSKFYLYPSERSEKKHLSPAQIKRLNHILISAMKQCGRLDLPSIETGFPKLDIPLFFGDLNKEVSPLLEKALLPAALVIGPEGGFTEKEIEKLKEKGQGVRLAPYILRTETAAITGLSILTGRSLLCRPGFHPVHDRHGLGQ